MKPFQPIENKEFIGRSRERKQLCKIGQSDEAEIVVLYGRRRVGKTELLEQCYRERNLLKFEGLEGQPSQVQMASVMDDLARYTEQPLLSQVQVQTWKDVFHHIYTHTQSGTWTIYFEELQWLAEYKDDFISILKFAWDNWFRRNPNLLMILCGSSPSFMIQHVMHSRSLYNRSQHEMHLQPLSLQEAAAYMGDKYSKQDIMDAYLTVGGIPLYLKQLKQDSSIWLSLCQSGFVQDAFFSKEHARIFVSSMSDDPNYKKVIAYLAKKPHATRADILKHLKISSGGGVTALLNDLELCGLMRKYAPVFSGKESRLARYAIDDPYLHFYYQFIASQQKAITQGKFNDDPTMGITHQKYQQWLGYAFERFCQRYAHRIAERLGFSAVQYDSGAYYNRSTSKDDPGYQIDLVYDRADNVLTVCEIKYLKDKVPSKVIVEFEKKLARLDMKKERTIHKVLITMNGAEQSVINDGYFDRILTVDDFF
ncbi:MAG: ATPase [marine bacterium B5-7]|nr:MAG: ATPase [marine bacterium B5-7]